MEEFKGFRKEKPTDLDQISIDRILQFILVDMYPDIDMEKFFGNGKKEKPATDIRIARQIFVYLCLKYTRSNNAEISRRMKMLSPSYITNIKDRMDLKVERKAELLGKKLEEKFKIKPVDNFEMRLFGDLS